MKKDNNKNYDISAINSERTFPQSNIEPIESL